MHDGTVRPDVNTPSRTCLDTTVPCPERLPRGRAACVTSLSALVAFPLGGGKHLVPTVPAASGTGTALVHSTVGPGREGARCPRGLARFPDVPTRFAACEDEGNCVENVLPHHNCNRCMTSPALAQVLLSASVHLTVTCAACCLSSVATDYAARLSATSSCFSTLRHQWKYLMAVLDLGSVYCHYHVVLAKQAERQACSHHDPCRLSSAYHPCP